MLAEHRLMPAPERQYSQCLAQELFLKHLEEQAARIEAELAKKKPDAKAFPEIARSVTVQDGELLAQLNREFTFGKVARDIPLAEKKAKSLQTLIDKDRKEQMEVQEKQKLDVKYHLEVVQRGHQWKVQKLFLDTVVAPLNRNIEFFSSMESFGAGEMEMASARQNVKNMKKALLLSYRSNMVMQKQIKCSEDRKATSEKKIREHIKQQKQQYVKHQEVSAPPMAAIRRNPPPYSFVSRHTVSKDISEVFTQVMASSGRDAYQTFDTLSHEVSAGVFDLLAAEILRQREREAVWQDLQGVVEKAWTATPDARIATLLQAAPGTYIRAWILDTTRKVVWTKQKHPKLAAVETVVRKLDDDSQLARTFRARKLGLQRHVGKGAILSLGIPEVWRRELLFADEDGGSVEVVCIPIFHSEEMVGIVESMTCDHTSSIDVQIADQISVLVHAAVMMLKSMKDEEAISARQRYLLDVHTNSIPLGVSQAKSMLQVVMCVTAWLKHVFNACNVSIAVHMLDESVDVYGLTEQGYLDRRKKIDQRYLVQYGPYHPPLLWQPLEYEERAEPGFGSLVAEVLSHGKSVSYRGLVGKAYRHEVDCRLEHGSGALMPLERIHFFSVPLLKRGAVRRVDAVLQFWCLHPESANGDTGVYDPGWSSHRSVMEKLQDWAHELVERHWGLKENAFEALMKSALKNSSGKELTRGMTKEAKSAERMSRQRTGIVSISSRATSYGARAPRNEEEEEMVMRTKQKLLLDIFEALLNLAVKESLTTTKAVDTMRDNLEKKRFSVQHYIEMWLKRLIGREDPVVDSLQSAYEEVKDMTTMNFGDDEIQPQESDEEVVEYGDDYENIVGKTIRTVGGNKLRITREVWDDIALLQSSWRKFWKRAREKNMAKLSSEELRNVIESLSNVIPADRVPPLDALTDRGEFGQEALARRKNTTMGRPLTSSPTYNSSRAPSR
jgi:hypothetical protein